MAEKNKASTPEDSDLKGSPELHNQAKGKGHSRGDDDYWGVQAGNYTEKGYGQSGAPTTPTKFTNYNHPSANLKPGDGTSGPKDLHDLLVPVTTPTTSTSGTRARPCTPIKPENASPRSSFGAPPPFDIDLVRKAAAARNAMYEFLGTKQKPAASATSEAGSFFSGGSVAPRHDHDDNDDNNDDDDPVAAAAAALEQHEKDHKELLKKLAKVQTIREAEAAAHEQEILSLRLQLEEAGRQLKEYNEVKAANVDIIDGLKWRNRSLEEELAKVAEMKKQQQLLAAASASSSSSSSSSSTTTPAAAGSGSGSTATGANKNKKL